MGTGAIVFARKGPALNDADRRPVSPSLGDTRSPSTTCDLMLAAMLAAVKP